MKLRIFKMRIQFFAYLHFVDKQNANDPNYIPMAPHYTSIAFKAACRLVLEGSYQPSGYTEPLLHFNRIIKKSNQN